MCQDTEFFLDRFEGERKQLLGAARCSGALARHIDLLERALHKLFSGGHESPFWEQKLLVLQEVFTEELYLRNSPAALDNLRQAVVKALDAYAAKQTLKSRQQAFHQLNYLYTNYWKLVLERLDPHMSECKAFSVLYRVD